MHPSAIGFHTSRNLIHCHAGRVTLPPDFAKCGGSRREVESAAKMAAVPVRKPSGRSVSREIFLRQI